MDSRSDSTGYVTDQSVLDGQNMVLEDFSPEQYELLQQLRDSKMTIEDVNFALDELDRLELQFNVSIVQNYY